MRFALHVTLLLLLFCATAPVTRPESGLDLLPPIQGWTLKPDPTRYTKANLYDLIDGAADLFLLYGFETLSVGEYWRNETVDVRVEVYDHRTSLNAFGMYGQERKPDYRFMAIGTQGYSEEGVLNFLKGQYYVKCSTHSTGAAAQRDLESVARGVEAHLQGEIAFPPSLRLLPSAERQPNSEMYIIQDYLGYSFFRSAFTARFGQKPSAELFVITHRNPAEATAAFEKYTGLFQGKALTGTDGAVRVDDPNNGRVTLFTQGNVLAGVVGCKEAEAERRFVALLRKSLRE